MEMETQLLGELMSIKCGSAHRKHTLSAMPLDATGIQGAHSFHTRPLMKSAIFWDV
jgi:hypothetical protein